MAITGITGSGKTTVSNMIKDLGFSVFDTDYFSKKIIRENKYVKEKLEHIVGKNISENGNINLKAIGDFFENYPDAEIEFEKWYQPYLGLKIKEMMSLLNNRGIYFFDIPLLNKKKIADSFDFILVIKSKKSNCFQRIKIRNNYSDKKIIGLIKNSKERRYSKIKKNIIIRNDYSIEQLRSAVEFELNRLSRLV